MKMTLSTPNNANFDKTSNKSLSPSSSPRSSPRPSPRPSTKKEHFKSDTHLTVNYKELPINRHDGSPSSQNGSSKNVDPTTPDNANKVLSDNAPATHRKEHKTKKKSSWFNAFYPTYKSRSSDFKRLFKDVPDDERLVVDYSCALQKEILVQGRLYVTQNYLCFHANIFGWETNVQLKWKDVSAITKEKTARVIPNAVLICTRSDRYFFASFVARDKTYLMLFRVWQNALMDQPMVPQEMWQWVHQSYGDELGLTSDDEDYVAPGTEEDKLSASKLSVESCSEECASNVDASEVQMTVNKSTNESLSSPTGLELHFPSDHSDSSDSNVDKPLTAKKCDESVQCSATHEGRQLLNEMVPIHIDQLFTLLFTSSKFYLDFHAARKTTDLTQTPWTQSSDDHSKSRIVNLTVALNQAMGPKTAQVTESQMMLPCSKAGNLYAIDIITTHAGIPYADSFYVLVHYCLQKTSEYESSITIYAQIKYKKSVWGLVKGMIEKNCWAGLEDFFTSLLKALHVEGEDNVPIKRKTRRKRRIHLMPRPGVEELHSSPTPKTTTISNGFFNSDVATVIVFVVLILLLILNVMLYYKLWSLEESPPYTLLDLHTLQDPPKSHAEWVKLLQQQETLHTVEMQKWQRVLKTAIKLLKQTEESLNELQRSIKPDYTNKILSVLQNHKDTVEKSQEL